MYIDNSFLDQIAEKAKQSPRLRMNFDLRNSADDKSQRMLNALEKGTQLPIHRHRTTIETVILLRGVIDEIFYDDQGNETERFRLDPANGKYGLQIPAGQWHTVEVHEAGVLIEMKEGPYEPLQPCDTLQ